MKNAYNTPKLTVYGNVKEITQAFGPSPMEDTIFAGQSNANQGNTDPGTVIGNSTGSQDGIVKPL